MTGPVATPKPSPEDLTEATYTLLEYGLHAGVVREVIPAGLRTLADQNGVWLVFEAPDGKRAVVHTGVLAKLSRGVAGEAIADWSQARLAAAHIPGA